MSPAVAGMLVSFLNLVWLLVLVRVMLSWVVRDPDQPVVRFLSTLTDPLLRPLSRFLTFGGIDLSPMVLLFAIRILQSVLRSYA